MANSFELFSRPWETPELTHENRLPMRATLYPYKDPKTALARDPKRSPYVRNLNGKWDFKLYKNVQGH